MLVVANSGWNALWRRTSYWWRQVTDLLLYRSAYLFLVILVYFYTNKQTKNPSTMILKMKTWAALNISHCLEKSRLISRAGWYVLSHEWVSLFFCSLKLHKPSRIILKENKLHSACQALLIDMLDGSTLLPSELLYEIS